jgi:hypothetical protein
MIERNWKLNSIKIYKLKHFDRIDFKICEALNMNNVFPPPVRKWLDEWMNNFLQNLFIGMNHFHRNKYPAFIKVNKNIHWNELLLAKWIN